MLILCYRSSASLNVVCDMYTLLSHGRIHATHKCRHLWYVHVHIHPCIYTCIHTCTCLHTCVHLCMHALTCTTHTHTYSGTPLIRSPAGLGKSDLNGEVTVLHGTKLHCGIQFGTAKW